MRSTDRNVIAVRGAVVYSDGAVQPIEIGPVEDGREVAASLIQMLNKVL